MDGEIDGTQETGQEQQGQQVDQAAGDDQQMQQETQQIAVAPTDEEIRAALAERDQKIADLERQVVEASKTVESAEALAKQIEELKAASDEERVGFGRTQRDGGTRPSRQARRRRGKAQGGRAVAVLGRCAPGRRHGAGARRGREGR